MKLLSPSLEAAARALGVSVREASAILEKRGYFGCINPKRKCAIERRFPVKRPLGLGLISTRSAALLYHLS